MINVLLNAARQSHKHILFFSLIFFLLSGGFLYLFESMAMHNRIYHFDAEEKNSSHLYQTMGNSPIDS